MHQITCWLNDPEGDDPDYYWFSLETEGEVADYLASPLPLHVFGAEHNGAFVPNPNFDPRAVAKFREWEAAHECMLLRSV